MPDYNPHQTVEFRELVEVVGPKLATRCFDIVALNRALQRQQELTGALRVAAERAGLDGLLQLTNEFQQLSLEVDRLIASAYGLADGGCIACALTAGGVCPDHA